MITVGRAPTDDEVVEHAADRRDDVDTDECDAAADRYERDLERRWES